MICALNPRTWLSPCDSAALEGRTCSASESHANGFAGVPSVEFATSALPGLSRPCWKVFLEVVHVSPTTTTSTHCPLRAVTRARMRHRHVALTLPPSGIARALLLLTRCAAFCWLQKQREKVQTPHRRCGSPSPGAVHGLFPQSITCLLLSVSLLAARLAG